MSDEFARALDPSALLRSKRVKAEQAPESDNHTLSLPPRPQPAPQVVQDQAPAPAPVPTPQPAPVQEAAAADEDPKESMTVRVRRSVRNRARQAYRLTGFYENEPSFEKFVETALENEIKRREQAYNNGNPYPGQNQRLSPGRIV